MVVMMIGIAYVTSNTIFSLYNLNNNLITDNASGVSFDTIFAFIAILSTTTARLIAKGYKTFKDLLRRYTDLGIRKIAYDVAAFLIIFIIYIGYSAGINYMISIDPMLSSDFLRNIPENLRFILIFSCLFLVIFIQFIGEYLLDRINN